VLRFEQLSLDPSVISSQAAHFSRERCAEAFRSLFFVYKQEMS
jgi:hypothetical protein